MAETGPPPTHTIHSVGAEHSACAWDNRAEPVLEIESGETVQLECADASGGQLTPNSTAKDVPALDMTPRGRRRPQLDLPESIFEAGDDRR